MLCYNIEFWLEIGSNVVDCTAYRYSDLKERSVTEKRCTMKLVTLETSWYYFESYWSNEIWIKLRIPVYFNTYVNMVYEKVVISILCLTIKFECVTDRF